MTKGQMAPTTLPNQMTTTTPKGRNVDLHGHPLRICELLSMIDGVSYLERVTTSSIAGINRMKTAIKKAFRYQMENKGFSLVEILSSCPTNWKMPPDESLKWIKENMEPFYPLGVFKDKGAAKQ